MKFPERVVSRRSTLVQLGAATLAAAGLPALAQGSAAGNWPQRPVRLMVPYPAGGGVDVLARALGIPQAVAAAISGEVDLTWAGIPSSSPHLASKRLKALAYGGRKRAAAFPDVPTAAEQGYPEIDANVWVGLFALSAMPQSLVDRI